MNRFSIDIEQSIEKRWLVKPTEWFHVLDVILFSIFPIVAIIISFVLIKKTKNPNENEYVVLYIVCPTLVFLTVYAFYRKITENKLFTVNTGISKKLSKEALLEFIKQNNYDKLVETSDLIVVTERHSLSFNDQWIKKITFIVCDNQILFNIVKNYPKLDPPVLFQHLLLKRDLQKLFIKP